MLVGRLMQKYQCQVVFLVKVLLMIGVSMILSVNMLLMMFMYSGCFVGEFMVRVMVNLQFVMFEVLMLVRVWLIMNILEEYVVL